VANALCRRLVALNGTTKRIAGDHEADSYILARLPALPILHNQKHHHPNQSLIWSIPLSSLHIKLIINTYFHLLLGTSNPRIDSLPVLSILQMDLKVPHRGLRTRRVQFPRTIVAPYPWQIHPFHAFGRRLTWWWGLARCIGSGIHGGVFHHAFKTVRWVLS
jgi:hypothetical protein